MESLATGLQSISWTTHRMDGDPTPDLTAKLNGPQGQLYQMTAIIITVILYFGRFVLVIGVLIILMFIFTGPQIIPHFDSSKYG